MRMQQCAIGYGCFVAIALEVDRRGARDDHVRACQWEGAGTWRGCRRSGAADDGDAKSMAESGGGLVIGESMKGSVFGTTWVQEQVEDSKSDIGGIGGCDKHRRARNAWLVECHKESQAQVYGQIRR